MYREISILFSNFLERYNYSIESRLRRENFIGLGASHFAILIGIILSEQKQLCMKDVADFINKDKSTVTQLVNKLIRYGLIEKKYCESDKRISYISLTLKGMENEELFMEIYNSTEFKDYGITIEEREELNRIVEKLLYFLK